MKILKIILLIVVILIALFLLVALFLPNAYTVDRSIVINKPVDEVYSYIADMNNRAEWDPWIEREPDAMNTFTVGDSTGVGSVWEWEGKELGKGSLKMIAAEWNKSIESELQFTEPQVMKSKIYWTFEPVQDGTNVTWSFAGDLSYPVERYFGLMMDKMMGPDFEKGLKNIKAALEKE
ncbi:MAG: SRPBCC family protein [candidate division KSB1 bacterium]|jgi:uncharacterized protein YndB with AHSA1/START domain|nr:SRPBCC family protein [candidate division KSB1 bacterium]